LIKIWQTQGTEILYSTKKKHQTLDPVAVTGHLRLPVVVAFTVIAGKNPHVWAIVVMVDGLPGLGSNSRNCCRKNSSFQPAKHKTFIFCKNEF